MGANMEKAREDTPMDRRRAATPIPIRFLRLKEVLAISGKSRSSIYEAIKKGEFPKPVKLGANSSAWINSEIDEWVQRCIQGSRSK
jgi:prophage regulatory protein